MLGCAPAARAPGGTPFDPQAGRLAVYVDPLPPEAAGLGVRLAAIDAVREDGSTVPLPLAREQISAAKTGGEHLLATGSVPAGRYRGLSVAVAEATLSGEQGISALRVPEGGRRIDLSFAVAPRTGTVILLGLDLRGALAETYRFDPAFVARIPMRPPAGLIGYAVLAEAGALLAFNKRTGQVAGLTPVGRSPTGWRSTGPGGGSTPLSRRRMLSSRSTWSRERSSTGGRSAGVTLRSISP